METYTDFGVSYLIQTKKNKYKIMKWLSSYPALILHFWGRYSQRNFEC